MGHPPNGTIASSSDWKTVDSKRVSWLLSKRITVSLLIDLIPSAGETNRLMTIFEKGKKNDYEIRTFESAGCDGRQLIRVQIQILKRIGIVCEIECARFD